MIEKLDPALCQDFRDAVNNSPTLSEEKEFFALYNLSCAVMDRLDSSIKYLNEHWDFPSSEEDFLCFIMFACLLNDGIDKIYRATLGTVPKCNTEKRYFKEFCMGMPAYLSEEECPTDEEFFEYFRALSFAHPYETNRNKVFKKVFGTQVSPWVVVNKHVLPFYHYPEPIGVRTYSSNSGDNDIHDIMFSFGALKGFLLEKYATLENVSKWIEEKSESTFNEWKQIKVNREQPDLDVLRDICKILDMRHESTYEIELMICYMSCGLSDNRNRSVVKQYREYLASIIPEICDCVDGLDISGQYEKERKASGFYPSGLHKMAHYQLEKIFAYLNERHSYVQVGSNEEWGLIQADAFYHEFANKWVHMDVYNMEYIEIKLLVTVALFMECKEQGILTK